MCKDHFPHFITLSLTDRRRKKLCYVWLKVWADLCDMGAQLAWYMKTSLLLMNFLLFCERCDVFWAALQSALSQFQCPVSGDKLEMAGREILTNMLTSQLSHRHLIWLIFRFTLFFLSFWSLGGCHLRFLCSVNLWWAFLVDVRWNKSVLFSLSSNTSVINFASFLSLLYTIGWKAGQRFGVVWSQML